MCITTRKSTIFACSENINKYKKGEFTMTNFKPKFIVQFIIDSLVLGIIFTILSRLAAAAFVSSLEGTAVCLPIILCTVLANVFAAGIAVFLTQNTLAKKDCSNIPDTIVFYIVLAAVLIILILLYTIFGFSTLEGFCTNNISALTVSEDDIHSAVKKSVIISDVVQAVVFLALIPLWKKRHDSLF